MALTRINNNQITDATIVASAKLQDNSISAGKLANNLNYGSNLTITGNLTVNGTSTTLDTVNTLIEDPILLLAKDQTGAASVDIGFVGERGDDTNIAWIWDEANDQFSAGFTSSDGSANTITLSSYADARVADITMVNLAPSGNVTTALNADSTIEAGTSITAGTTVTATGNVSGGNLTTAGQVAADNADITNGITAGTTITATGNVSGGNVTTAGQVQGDNFAATNGITAGTTITATGNITGGNLITAGTFSAASISAVGNITGGNLVTAGSITDGVLTIDNGSITGGDAATFANTITGGSLTDGTATISSGAITGATSGSFSSTLTATGNVTGGNLITAGTMDSATINTTGEATLASATVSDLTSGRVVLAGTSGAIEDSANMTFDGSTLGITGAITASTTVTATGNVVGGNVTTAGDVDATGTITGGTLTDGTASINGGAITGATSGSFSSTLTATGNITGGNINTAGIVTATGNVSGGNLTTGGDINASGDISGLTITSATFQGGTPTIQSTTANADIILNPNGTGSIDASNAKIIQLATPTADGDAANKAYVDSVAEGLDIKGSCVAATTGALPAVTYNNGSSGVGATLTADANGALAAIDGVTLVADERVLVKNQASALQNGIYVVTTVGDGSNPFVLTRATDFDQGSPSGEIPGGFTFIEEGSTNADAGFVCTTNAPVTMGTTAINFTQFSGAGAITAGDGLTKTGDTLDVNVDDVTTAIVGDAVVVKASANLTTPNIGVANGDSLTVTGNVDGVSANFSGVAVVTGNVTGGNLNTGGAVVATGLISSGTTITATGNVAGGNLTTAGAMDSATINTTGEATLASAIVSDLTAGRVVLAGTSGAIEDSGNFTFDGSTAAVTGAITATTTITATGNVSGGNLTTAGQVAADNADITNGITAGTTITATGNVSGGNVTTAGQVAADNADITNGITAGTTITATGNVTGGNLTTAGAITDGTFSVTSGVFTGVVSIDASGNVDSGNVNTGIVDATGAISSDTTITATGNVAGGNLTTAGQVAADNADITNGITAGTTITATGNVSGGNLTTAGAVDATGDVTGANLKTGNITIGTDDITSAGTAITVNQDAQDVDFIVEGSSNANLLTIDAGTDTIVVGSASTTTGATFKVDATDSQMIPVGTTAQRPTGVTGMIRFNTTLDQFEFYDSNSWTTAGSDFTVISSETFSGDNSTTAFTLGSTQTTASCIVSINGVVQEPTTAYAVSGTTLTFTEAPLAGDTIEVRQITTTSTILGLASDDTSSSVTTEDGGDVAIKGNIIPTANATYDLGSASERWNDLYLTGNTITLGNVVIKNTGGNAVGFFGPDGSTPGVIDANVEIAGDSIVNGTSSVDFSGVNGDVRLTSGGTQSLTVISTGANVVGDFATTGDVRFLDSDNSNYVGFQAPATVSSDLVWTLPSADAGVSGYALVSDGAGTLSFAAAGATVSSDTSTDTDFLLYFASTTTGALTGVKQDSGLIYNPSSGLLTSAAFSGDGSALTALNGSQVTTGTIAAARVATLNQDTTGTAAIATTITVADESSDTTCFPLFATAATGDLGAKSGSNLTFNSSTGVLAATTFSGSGASLTSLNGSNISTGTIAAARVATLNQNTTGTAGGFSSAVTVELTGPVTGSATFTSAGDTASIATTLTADPTITLTGAVTGSATMTNLGNVSITTTATSDPTITLAGDLTGSATLTNLGSATLTATIAANSVALGTDTTGNYVATIAAGEGIDVSGSGSESAAVTISAEDATDTNKGIASFNSTDFSVSSGAVSLAKDPVITLTGAVTGSATMTNLGNVSIATTATSDPTITLAGDLTGSATLTNLGSATLTATIAANSVALGTDTTGNYVGAGATSGSGISGSVSSEGGTFTVTSNATSANTASTIVFRDGSGNFSAGVITATATAARYADLAEMYAADGDIEAGTVVHFAGEGKLAACDQANHHAVAGIISTDPAYLMNTDQQGVALAISGRVPCKVTGVVNAGDLMVSAGNGRAMANNSPAIGTVIGKAIESNAGGEAVIEVLAMMM